MDAMTRKGIENIFTEEIGKVVMASRSDGISGGNLLPYLQGRSADKQGKIPLLMASSAMKPGSRGFSLPALAAARDVGRPRPGNPVTGKFTMEPLQDFRGIQGRVSEAMDVRHFGFADHFEMFNAINKAKNPEKLVDNIILQRIANPGNEEVPHLFNYLIQPTEENSAKLVKEFEKNRVALGSRQAQNVARAEVTKDVLKAMSYDDKLALVLPKVMINQDAMEFLPNAFKDPARRLSTQAGVDEVLEEFGYMKDGRMTKLGEQQLGSRNIKQSLASLLRHKEQTRPRNLLPFLDALNTRFVFAHELDHLRDFADKSGGQFGLLPSSRKPDLLELSDQLALEKRTGSGRPTATQMEKMADIAGFRSLADITPDGITEAQLKKGNVGIPKVQFQSRVFQADDSQSLYRYGKDMAEQAFGPAKRIGGRLPIRAFGVLGAIGLLGALAAASSQGGSRGNA
jgi:hypothetical protein